MTELLEEKGLKVLTVALPDRSTCGWSTSRRAGPVPTAARRCPPSIMRQSGRGAISTRVSFRRTCMPWAEPRSRFTVLLERLIIDLIL